MARIDPFELMSNLEFQLTDDMECNHPLRVMLNAIRESIVPTSDADTKELEWFLERERVRNK